MVGTRRRLRLHEFPRVTSSLQDAQRFLRVVPHFVTGDEEAAFVRALTPKLQRQRYQGTHWDAVINRYKETELPPAEQLPEHDGDGAVIRAVMQRTVAYLRRATQSPTMAVLPPHVIDLAADGHIGPHVDSVKFSGGMVAGLSLLSDRVMRLSPCSPQDAVANETDQLRVELPYLPLLPPDTDTDTTADAGSGSGGAALIRMSPSSSSAESGDAVDLHLPRLSLYILTGPFRYLFTHAVLGAKDGAPTPPERRVSVVFRDTYT